MSIKQIQDRICQLIHRAETFLKQSQQLLDIYDKSSDKCKESANKECKLYNYHKTKCIILHQVLYFQEVVIILNTLFENKKHPTEMSFSYYFTKSKNKDLKNEINKIRDEYRTFYLNKGKCPIETRS